MLPTTPHHQPVLLSEIICRLTPQDEKIYIDGTVGAGGHAQAILEATSPSGRLIGLDQDETALNIAATRLAKFGERVMLVQANFRDMEQVATQFRVPPVDGILLDIGVSSMQFDQGERGFSFQVDAPLDMRMDRSQGDTAADLVNHLSEQELADVIYQYGEEHQSRRIARAIVNQRPIERTLILAQIVKRAKGGSAKRAKIHPATKTFQALRIAVNDELGALTDGLTQAVNLLKPGGRLAVISFHSLEDRIVKQFFRQAAQDCICPSEQLFCTCDHQATLKVITRKPIVANNEEIDQNPCARSAKLRVAERLK